MKTKYKYIHFIEIEELVGEKKVWECRNNKNNALLSQIFYYVPWRQWCFTQYEQNIVFSADCLADTIDFIKQLNEADK